MPYILESKLRKDHNLLYMLQYTVPPFNCLALYIQHFNHICTSNKYKFDIGCCKRYKSLFVVISVFPAKSLVYFNINYFVFSQFLLSCSTFRIIYHFKYCFCDCWLAEIQIIKNTKFILLNIVCKIVR